MKNEYIFPIILLTTILLGGFFGYVFPEKVQYIEPVGELFLQSLLTLATPLVFFSVASAIAKLVSSQKAVRLFFNMLFTFLFTSALGATMMISIIKLYPLTTTLALHPTEKQISNVVPSLKEYFLQYFSLETLLYLFSPKNLLPLIVAAVLLGLIIGILKRQGQQLLKGLELGTHIFTTLFSLLMYFAPLGFFAYFAVLIHQFGPALLTNYYEVTLIYYVFGLFYFACVYSFYSFLVGNKKSLYLFWKYISLPTFTSLATCSSAASIPASLQAAKSMKIPPTIYEAVIPLGTFLHKEGSVLGGVLKIAFLFSLFQMDFSGMALLNVIFISILVGTVMGAIPSGGMLGELLIISFYGFPADTLLMIAAISLIIDPLATMLNVTGNCLSSMIVSRLSLGKIAFNKAISTHIAGMP